MIMSSRKSGLFQGDRRARRKAGAFQGRQCANAHARKNGCRCARPAQRLEPTQQIIGLLQSASGAICQWHQDNTALSTKLSSAGVPGTQCVTEPPPVTPPFQKRRIGGFGSRNCYRANMTAITHYQCNLCHRDLDHRKSTGSIPDGWPVRWTGPVVARPELGDNLESADWSNAPIHICQNCVRAMGLFRDWVERESTLLKPPPSSR